MVLEGSDVQMDYVGEGQVVLIAGGGKIWTDIAARFVRSERDLDEIISSGYSPEIVRNILESGHLAATEFDLFIFGVSGYSRVCEAQLVRKRMASYLIKSGRQELGGKRRFKVTIPESIKDAGCWYKFKDDNGLTLQSVDVTGTAITTYHPPREHYITPEVICDMISTWYDKCLQSDKGYKEEDLRYLKPQATQFQGIIAMNAHALRDWFKIRLCQNAQAEIRDLATKMRQLAVNLAPDLMKDSGPSCTVLGYCPEGKLQNPRCKGKIPTKAEVQALIKKHYKVV